MRLWKFVPVAQLDDPYWQDRPVWREVIVRADTSGLARSIASKLEVDLDAPNVGNETLSQRNGLEDPSLYQAVELTRTEAAAFGGGDGPEGIVRADMLRDRPAPG